LIAWLNVQGVRLHKLEKYPFGFAPLFYGRGEWPEKNWPIKPVNVPEYPFAEAEMTLAPDILKPSKAQTDSAPVAEADLNYASLKVKEEIANVVALTLNQFIRSLGHLANLQRLRQEAGRLAAKICL
jgi:hypothetical protein